MLKVALTSHNTYIRNKCLLLERFVKTNRLLHMAERGVNHVIHMHINQCINKTLKWHIELCVKTSRTVDSIFNEKSLFCEMGVVLCLLAIVLCVLLRLTVYQYPFGIFKLFSCSCEPLVSLFIYAESGLTSHNTYMRNKCLLLERFVKPTRLLHMAGYNLWVYHIL